MKKLVAVCAAFCALTLPALAADIDVSPLGTYRPSRPVYSWTGCRIGANIGGGSAHTSWNDPFGTVLGAPAYLGDHTASGVIGGGQLGCDYQVGRIVFGIQGLYDLTGMKASNIEAQPAIVTVPRGSFSVSLIDETFIQSSANVTARIGYAVQPSLLLYGKAGVAWNHNLYNISTPGQQVSSREITILPTGVVGPVFTVPPAVIVAQGSNSRVGPVVGTGLEWAVFGTDVSLFLEYDYLHFGTNRATLLPVLGSQIIPIDITQNVNMVLFGINYRFYGGAPSY
jgi:outer membrane immunogenic protein